MAVASHLVRPTRSSNDPGRVSLLIWPCSDRGLPCRACCQTRGGLLPHRFTLTLWIQGRSVLWSSDFPRWTPLADPPRPSAPPLPEQETTGPPGPPARLTS